MVDVLGPASDNAVTSRPTRSIIRGIVNTWFKDCSGPDAADGTEFGADFFNDALAQFRQAFSSAGITVDNADDMLWRAMQSTGIRYGTASGTANDITVTFTPPVPALFAGLPLLIKLTADCSGPMTIAADATAAKSLKWPDNTALVTGDAKNGMVILVAYDGTRYHLLSRANAGTASAKFVPGTIHMWPLDAPPTGTLLCDGSAVSRATYSTLFGILGTAYGPGDGSTTFNVPDMRGRFPRGWANGSTNDPDRASRTTRGDGTTGDHTGTKQADQTKAHNHAGSSTSNIVTASQIMSDGAGNITAVTVDPPFPAQGGAGGNVPANAPVNISTFGGSESRPINIAVNFVIAY